MSRAEPVSWRGRAFGLQVSGDFPAPGLDRGADGAAPPHGPSTLLRLVRPPEIPLEQTGDVGLSVQRDAAGHYLFEHVLFGHFRVAPDGSSVDCAPTDLPGWLWQRMLVGQLLPLASLLRGFEPLHAGAVALLGQAVLIMGPSGAGKSSVSLHLAANGAGLMSDDVSALELRGGQVVAHAGAAVASVDRAELARIPPEGKDAWRRLGEHEGEVRVAIEHRGPLGPLPVAAVYVLSRRSEPGALEVGPPRVGTPGLLLGGTFNAYVRDPRRLRRQLEVSGRLAETAPIHEVVVPPGVGAAEVAAAVAERHGGAA